MGKCFRLAKNVYSKSIPFFYVAFSNIAKINPYLNNSIEYLSILSSKEAFSHPRSVFKEVPLLRRSPTCMTATQCMHVDQESLCQT